eukprot:366465-Chlamydomonas_euryale.AAC.2
MVQDRGSKVDAHKHRGSKVESHNHSQSAPSTTASCQGGSYQVWTLHARSGVKSPHSSCQDGRRQLGARGA